MVKIRKFYIDLRLVVEPPMDSTQLTTSSQDLQDEAWFFNEVFKSFRPQILLNPEKSRSIEIGIKNQKPV